MAGEGLSENSQELRGLIPRVLEYIFNEIERIAAEQQEKQMSFSIACSYLEIYNETVIDLLNTSKENLRLLQDPDKNVYVENLTEETVTKVKDCIDVLNKGAFKRHTGETCMNAKSSRSHSVFTLQINSKYIEDDIMHTRKSRFYLVDLAGSERQKSTKAVGARLKEGCNINKSLSILGNVINSLVEVSEGKQRYIHYRDSKLTYLLKDSLGGNSKTSLIANISPSSKCVGETVSTLKFASRAKKIKNKASINEDS